MKKFIYILAALSLVILAGCGKKPEQATVDPTAIENAQKAKLIDNITDTLSSKGSNPSFVKCVKTTDKSVYATITDKEKMKNLKASNLQNVNNVNNVLTSCKSIN